MSAALESVVVVVGGAGFLGRSIIRQWKESLEALPTEERLKVVSVDLRPNDSADVSISADLMDMHALERKLFHRFSVQSMVVAVKPPLAGASYQFFIELNVSALIDLCTLARRHNVGQFIFASSIACCSHFVAHWQCREADPAANPPLTTLKSPYDLSKAMAEQFVLQCHSPTGMRTVSIRIAGIYGGEDDQYLNRRLPLGLSFDLMQNPANPHVDSNFVENAAAAFIRAEARLREDASVGGRFYFYTTGDRRVNQQELSATLARVSGRLHIGTPSWLVKSILGLAHWLAVFRMMLTPSWPFSQPVSRAVQPKPHMTLGSIGQMGFIDQNFDDSLFKETFGFTHLYSVEQAVEQIARTGQRCQPARGPCALPLACVAVTVLITAVLAACGWGNVDHGSGRSLSFDAGVFRAACEAAGMALVSVLAWLLAHTAQGKTTEHVPTVAGRLKAASGLWTQAVLCLGLLAYHRWGQKGAAAEA